MWDNSAYRARAKALQKNAGKKKLQMHLLRTSAEIMVTEDFGVEAAVIACRVMLNDLQPLGIYVYSTAPLPVGKEISVTLQLPKRFYAKGVVAMCVYLLNEQRVLGPSSFPYRIAVEFTFQNEEERTAVREYCEEMMREHVYDKEDAA